ncbi:MAG: DUF975 domain-containing protein [Calothrix sp. MO_167.B42]|nr:DUF975 domain-containing protein [Calothrix sp. MO_167.B42]
MSFSPNPSSSLQPLSIGNVVSAGIRLYRSHFKQYLCLTLQSFLWFLIPIYGWAKAFTINAMISRLAFAELINQPESEKDCRSELNSRIWNFLVTQILVGLMIFGVNLLISILRNIIIGVANQPSIRNPIVSFLVVIVAQLGGYIAYLWFYARVFLPELPMAVENTLDAGQAIARSWELTKGNVWRLQAIIFVASLITIPLVVIAGIPFIIAMISISTIIVTNPDAMTNPAILNSFFLSIIIGIVLMLLVNAIINPFWQAIKAVIYYDLRARREGLGLQLRDRKI